MRMVRFFTVAALMTSLVLGNMFPSSSPANAKTGVLEPTKVVRILPSYGYTPAPLRIRLSYSEQQVVTKLQWFSTQWVPPVPVVPSSATLLIEPSAQDSETLRIGLAAMRQVESLLVRPLDITPTRTYVIVGRTQKFLKDKVHAIGCVPDLTATNGVFLMGATLCNRQVIVINLTGYLFLKSRYQQFFPAMETFREPPIAATSYLIADRNLGGLAHEWAHVARSRLSIEPIPDNEPTWMREGLAEIISGMARVKASKGRMTYLDFHSIRLRKFTNWTDYCKASTTAYRVSSSVLSGCEYFRGAIAAELLIANYGGIPQIMNLYKNASASGDFLEGFRQTYGMSLRTFELRADKYVSYVSQAAHYSKSN